MISIVLAIWLPWLRPLWRGSPKVFKAAAGLSAFTLVFAFAVGLVAFLTGIDTANEKAEAIAFQRESKRNLSEQDAVRRQTQLLSTQSSRLYGQLAAAIARNDPIAQESLLQEIKSINRFIELDFKHESELMLESANLYREMVGAKTLKKLPLKAPENSQAKEPKG
jgi:hypothetical protein